MKFLKAMVLMCMVTVLAACQTAPGKHDGSKPDAPSGMSWYKANNGVGEFLRPNGWYIKEQSQNFTNSLFISKENIDTNGRFLTGLTVNRYGDWSVSSKKTPSESAKEMAGKFASTGNVLLNRVMAGNGYVMYAVRVASDNNGVKTTAHYLVAGMDQQNVLYMMVAESPTAEWEANVKYLGPMMDVFYPQL